MQKKWIMPVILATAIFFRFFRITESPPSLNWDEVSIGYNAYSILQTGKDEWGVRLPLAFKAYGEYKLPGMIYASIPAISVFGLNDLGVRVTPAIIGVLTVFVLYLLGTELYSRKIGYIASFLMAISPWHVHISRASFEAGLALLFIELSILFFIRSQKNNKLIIPSLLFSVLALYSYNSARIFIPLLIISYYFLFRKLISRKKKYYLVGIGISLILLIPAARIVTNQSSQVRWDSVQIADDGFYQGVGESRRYTLLPDPLPRLIQNKYTHYLHRLFTNYISHFSTEFLIFKGGVHTQRSVQGMGLLYLFELPLLILGLRKIGSVRTRKILLPWLLLAPIPSIITIDSPDALRSLSVLPPLLLIISLGAQSSFKWLKTRTFTIKAVIVMFIVWNISYFAYRLFGVYPLKYASDWQYGYKQAIGAVMQDAEDAEKVYITTYQGEPYMYLLFYGGIDPREYQNSNQLNRGVDEKGWVHVDKFGKFEFVDFTSQFYKPETIIDRNEGSIVFVGGFGDIPGGWPITKEVTAPDGSFIYAVSTKQAK